MNSSSSKKQNRVAALCIGVAADGVIESIYESFRAESLSQLWLHKLNLVKRYSKLEHKKMIIGCVVLQKILGFNYSPPPPRRTIQIKISLLLWCNFLGAWPCFE